VFFYFNVSHFKTEDLTTELKSQSLGVNAKGFYLLLYSTAIRALLLSPLAC